MGARSFEKDLQYYKFCLYGFFKNLRLFEPFIILIFLDSGLSFLQIGVLYSVREIGRNILEIPAGIIADTLGRRKTMIASFVFYIISFIVFFIAGTFPVFIAAMALYALGDAFRTGTHKAMIFTWLHIRGWEDQKVHYYGHTRSCSQLGSAVSALVAGILVFFTESYRMIFLFSALPYLMDLILISTYPAALEGVQEPSGKRRIREGFREVIRDFLTTFRSRSVLRAVSNLSVYTGYYRALRDYLQPVLVTVALSMPLLAGLDERQRSSVLIGVVYFVIYLLTSWSSRNAGRFTDRFAAITTPLNVTLLTGLLAGALCGILYMGDLAWAAALIFIAIYVVENLRKPIGISFVSERIGGNILASALSAESQAHSLIAAILAPLLGYIADATGIGIALLVVSGALLLFSPLIFARKGDLFRTPGEKNRIQ